MSKKKWVERHDFINAPFLSKEQEMRITKEVIRSKPNWDRQMTLIHVSHALKLFAGDCVIKIYKKGKGLNNVNP